MGGLGGAVAPVVGSPTHPVMPNLVVLWKMSPLRIQVVGVGEGGGALGSSHMGRALDNGGSTSA
jgi:hypothetical protein